MPNLWDDDGNENETWGVIRHAADKIDDKKEGDRGLNSNLEEQMGLCAKCKHFVYNEDDLHQIVFSACSGLHYDYSVTLSGKRKISNCSKYEARGQLNIETLFATAHIIDLDNLDIDRKQAGFLSREIETKKEK